MKLFVLNQTEEFVCEVDMEPALITASKLVVVSYTRDPDILGPKYRYECEMKPKTPDDARKYSSFMRYIIDRKKVLASGCYLL